MRKIIKFSAVVLLLLSACQPEPKRVFITLDLQHIKSYVEMARNDNCWSDSGLNHILKEEGTQSAWVNMAICQNWADFSQFYVHSTDRDLERALQEIDSLIFELQKENIIIIK